jgi:hypothetical protein
MRKQSEATNATVNMRFLLVFNFFLFFPAGTLASKSSKEWSRDDVIFSEEKEDIIRATMRFKKSAFFNFFLSVFFVGGVSEEDNNNRSGEQGNVWIMAAKPRRDLREKCGQKNTRM